MTNADVGEEKTYLDHAGSQLPAKRLIDSFAADLNTNLYGNPHSASTPSHLAGERIDEIRERTLRFFNASPADFDLIFVSNATAAVRLVAECVCDYVSSFPASGVRSSLAKKPIFSFSCHRDSHNSLVGIRELARTHRCVSDEGIEAWISSPPSKKDSNGIHLVAYPGQSNFNGRRLPLHWPRAIRKVGLPNTYTLLDAAALATTAPLNLDAIQPDFTAISFYKIFGFPDLGALIVRKASGTPILSSRRYFGGGTVDIVVTSTSPTKDGKAWHVKRSSLHEQLEEGTLPFRAIFALGHALRTHAALFGAEPMSAISARTAALSAYAYQRMVAMRHRNGAAVFVVYKDARSTYGDAQTQGATIAFNVLRPDGEPHGFKDVERAADKRGIYVRSGGHCNPGGIAAYLGWTPRDMKVAYEELGHSCSNPIQVLMGRAMGVVRISLGACSVKADIDNFLCFVREEYVDKPVVSAPKVGFSEILTEVDSGGSSPELDSGSGADVPLGSLKRLSTKGRNRRFPKSLVDLSKVRKMWNSVGIGMIEVDV